MSAVGRPACVLLVVVTVSLMAGGTAPAARAVNPVKPVCGVAGLFSGVLGKACSVAQNGGRWVKAGNKLLGGHVGAAAKAALGGGGSRVATAATTTVGIAAIATSVLGGAKTALSQTATVLGHTTSPQLDSTWFSSMYWQVAGISAMLTMPFLFAAAIQALLRSDLTLLLRATLGYLPLAVLAVSVAAPIAMLLLAASDQLSAVVSSAAGGASAHFLRQAGTAIGTLTLLSGSPFLAIMVGLLILGGALALWIELLMREAAVYVIVLMLPLAFASMVWPARRIWAVRAIELLVALILSKFAIVAVLSLGSAALSAGAGHGLTVALAGVVLLLMGAFAPWALLRLLPLAELASSAAGSLRGEVRGGVVPTVELAAGSAGAGDEWASSATAQMRRDASDAAPDHSDPAADAVGTPTPAPAEEIALDESEVRVSPQGGAGVASQGVSESPNDPAPASGGKLEPVGAKKPPVQTRGEPVPKAEASPPMLQEMWRDEHRGEFRPHLDDAPVPPPRSDGEPE